MTFKITTISVGNIANSTKELLGRLYCVVAGFSRGFVAMTFFLVAELELSQEIWLVRLVYSRPGTDDSSLRFQRR
jgi:hypothetical protein